MSYQYITSLYWAAATSASVGYGDIHAYTVGEVRRIQLVNLSVNQSVNREFSFERNCVPRWWESKTLK